MSPRPHALNVLGPFYVEDGCCTSCGVPQQFAQTLFAEDKQGHCFVKRQPQNTTELDAMLRTVATQELGCIHYRGADEAILQRLVDAGERKQCDVAVPPHLVPMLRDHATFANINGNSARWIADRLRDYLTTLQGFNCKLVTSNDHTTFVALDVSWFQSQVHRVEVGPDGEEGRWLLRHVGPHRFSHTLHDWLMADESFTDVRWQTSAEWHAHGSSRTPW